MPAKRPTLTAKQAAFAREYVVDCNATAAAIRAGYSARTASQQSYDLIRNPAVAAEIERLTAEKVARSQITADEILMELAHIARADMGNVIAWGSTTVEIDAEGNVIAPESDMAGHGVQTDVPFVRAFDSATLPPHIRAAVSEVSLTDKGSFKIKLHDKIGAIEKLMRHLGMFEKDNKQKADGLVELIQAAQGSALPIAGGDDE